MQLKPSYMIEVFIIVVGMGLIATVMSTKKLKKADPVDLFLSGVIGMIETIEPPDNMDDAHLDRCGGPQPLLWRG